uniref:DRBM domain-containing protein n=1 Tax=Syphacia muris TaxID=451379 RepID=A0A0N5AB75_9BILA
MLECSPAPGTVTTASFSQSENVKPKQSSPSSFKLQPWCGVYLSDQESVPLKNVYNYAEIDKVKPKTPMCRIAELARYNKLKHEYKLMDESGPAHRKLFRVSLILAPDQVFDGCGASIKKAQRAAAETALRETVLPHPPNRTQKKSGKKGCRDPVFRIICIAQKLGLELNFSDVGLHTGGVPPPPPPPALLSPNRMPVPLGRGNFIPTIPNNQFVPMPQVPLQCPSPTQNFPMYLMTRPLVPYPNFPFGMMPFLHQVRLTIGPEFPVFLGVGPNKIKAKRHAALQALNFLTPRLSSLEKEKENITSGQKENASSVIDEKSMNFHENGVPKNLAPVALDQDVIESQAQAPSNDSGRAKKPKSAITQIHEYAFHMRMNVEFEVISEDGPAHNRHYVYQCRLISPGQVVVAEGEGGSKKLARQNACAVMLTKLKELENSSSFFSSTLIKPPKKAFSQKESKKKTVVMDMKMDPDYGHQINPVSRLIQVMQARKEPEPKFQLVMEYGQSRYKEFVVEVTCMDGLRCKGTGPNKKLAKRAAAEAMLATIGCVKPMPKPGKSLLKRRLENQNFNTEETVDIGVFNSNESSQVKNSCSNMDSIDKWKPEMADESLRKDAVSEVTLSVTASFGSQIITFADVDQKVKAEEKNSGWGKTMTDSNSHSKTTISESTTTQAASVHTAPASVKRVTFSNEVSAFPPPDDSSYPAPSITPLKSDVVFVSKMRRRGRDTKKKLTDEQRHLVACTARSFLSNWKESCKHAVYTSHPDISPNGSAFMLPTNLSAEMSQLSIADTSNHVYWPSCEKPLTETARQCLERIAETIKFSIGFSDFPKVESDGDLKYFSLISLGIEKPLVCHGRGDSEDAAHDNAAYNVLVALSSYDVIQQP